MAKVALMGAGGKMGCRITDNLRGNAAYQVTPVETGLGRDRQAGRARALPPVPVARRPWPERTSWSWPFPTSPSAR